VQVVLQRSHPNAVCARDSFLRCNARSVLGWCAIRNAGQTSFRIVFIALQTISRIIVDEKFRLAMFDESNRLLQEMGAPDILSSQCTLRIVLFQAERTSALNRPPLSFPPPPVAMLASLMSAFAGCVVLRLPRCRCFCCGVVGLVSLSRPLSLSRLAGLLSVGPSICNRSQLTISIAEAAPSTSASTSASTCRRRRCRRRRRRRRRCRQI
jgi:hypothetical protein